MGTSLEQALGEEVEEVATEPEIEAEAVEAVEEAPEPEGQEPEVEAEPDPVPRDEKGKFTKKDKPDGQEPEAWSYAAYKDEKENKQRYKREAEELRAEVERLRTQQPQQKRIDPIDDPEGFERSLEQRLEQRLLNERIQFSERFARSQYGEEMWEQTNGWLMTQPDGFRQQFLQSSDPCGDAVKAFKRHQAMQEIGDDPAAYRERLEAEIRERVLAEMQPAAPQQPSQPKPSNFASARSAGKRTGPSWAGPTPLSSILPE